MNAVLVSGIMTTHNESTAPNSEQAQEAIKALVATNVTITQKRFLRCVTGSITHIFCRAPPKSERLRYHFSGNDGRTVYVQLVLLTIPKVVQRNVLGGPGSIGEPLELVAINGLFECLLGAARADGEGKSDSKQYHTPNAAPA